MLGFVVSVSSASSVIRRRIRASESKPGRSLIEPAWLNHNAWILLETRIRKVRSGQQRQTEPVRAAVAVR